MKRRGHRKRQEKSLEQCLFKWREHLPVETADAACLQDMGVDASLFVSSDDVIEFPPSLNASQRKLLHQLCFSLDLFHTSVGMDHNRYLKVSRQFPATTESQDEHALKSTSWHDPSIPKPRLQAYYFSHEEELMQSPTLPWDMSSCEPLALKLMSFAQDSSMQCLSIDEREVKSEVPITYQWVDTHDALVNLSNELASADLIAFDCEMHQHRSYYGITCLLQLASNKGKAYIVDSLALWDEIPKYLSPLFKNPAIIKIGHSLDGGDVPYLYRDFGIHVMGVFDTKIAAEAMGIKKVGLASLLERYHCPCIEEIRLGKQNITNSDWRQRPLNALHLRYAALDVLYLIPLCLEMVKEMSRRINVLPMKDKLTEDDGDIDNDVSMEGPEADEDLHRVLRLEEIDDNGYEDDEDDWEGWGITTTKSPLPDSACDAEKVDPAISIASASPMETPGIEMIIRDSNSFTVSQVLLDSQKVCDAKWRPKMSKDNDYRQVLKLRRKSQKWSEKQIFILKRLFQWRDAMARLHDESPAYICPPYLLLNAAFYIPRNFEQLTKVWSPLPVFIENTEKSNDDSGGAPGFLMTLENALQEFESSVVEAVITSDLKVYPEKVLETSR